MAVPGHPPKTAMGIPSTALLALTIAVSAWAGEVRTDTPDPVELIIIEIYRLVGVIDDSTPTTEPLEGTEIVVVNPVDPLGHDLEIEWTLDGRRVARSVTALDLALLDAVPGEHLLSVTVSDPTKLVRNEAARERWLTDTVTWMLVVTTAADLDGDLDVDVHDLEMLLELWGRDPAGPPDFDADGTVGTPDLLHLLAHWTGG